MDQWSRVAGTDRYRTAAAVAEAYPTADSTYVASGQDWPDALAGAALAGREEVPMLLVRKDSAPRLGHCTAVRRRVCGVRGIPCCRAEESS